MLNKEKVTALMAKKDEIPFLDQCTQLRAAGVYYYDVDLKTGERIYGSYGERLVEKMEHATFAIAATFSDQLIQKALSRRRNKETTYIQFLQELAHAGVSAYRVDIMQSRVTYHGNGHEYAEHIPLPRQHCC